MFAREDGISKAEQDLALRADLAVRIVRLVHDQYELDKLARYLANGPIVTFVVVQLPCAIDAWVQREVASMLFRESVLEVGWDCVTFREIREPGEAHSCGWIEAYLQHGHDTCDAIAAALEFGRVQWEDAFHGRKRESYSVMSRLKVGDDDDTAIIARLRARFPLWGDRVSWSATELGDVVYTAERQTVPFP
ncbi:MAG: hypothetical protein NUV56_01910 [Candidatus Uhrbacteria bacterium]|nr:hypothetical protein [Candidatus Uhrbacteria bacterium]